MGGRSVPSDRRPKVQRLSLRSDKSVRFKRLKSPCPGRSESGGRRICSCLGQPWGRSYALTQEAAIPRYPDQLPRRNGHTTDFRDCFGTIEKPLFTGAGETDLPCLGLAETLTYLPQSQPLYADILLMYQKLLNGLLKYQRSIGLLPPSYHATG